MPISHSEYELSDITYSIDNSDKNSQEFKTNITEVKKKVSYTGSSIATYYQKYSSSGTYTKAAKGSLLLTEFFALAQSNLANVNLTEDDETRKNNNLLNNNDADRIDVSDGEENSDNDFNTNEIIDLEDFDDVFTEKEDNNEFDLNTVNNLKNLNKSWMGNKYSPDWPFRLLRMFKGKKRNRYIKNNHLVLVGKHAEPKWELVKNAFHIFANSPDPYRENISFQTIKAEKFPDISKFSPKGSTIIVFEDLCAESKKIQERSGSREDICRVVCQYTNDPKKAFKIIDKHLQNQNFIVFDFTKAIDDPLAIRLDWDTPLKLNE
ncbi:hypothetical protein C1646_751146 [Rhizophagus diaphanus]|nr:hypothetical protein C1646_751146 [Rhizophagus diaphanus] [Rhizophagus sp. MUCL 43196]